MEFVSRLQNSKFKQFLGAAFAAIVFLGPLPAVAAGAAMLHVVIDAGSSGSKIYLYDVKPGSYPDVEQILSFKGVPGDEGLDNFLDGSGGVNRDAGPEKVASAIIVPLLEKVTSTLTDRGVSRADVTVDVLATAGMRSAVIPYGKHEPAKAEALYDEIRKAIASEGFAVGEVRTTDGSAEEGLWTWIDVNDRYRDAFRGSSDPVGIVEVGGSSMQVSFPTTAAVDPARNVYPVSINGKNFSVFDRTYPGLGMDDARRAMRVAGREASGGAQCFPTGMTPADDSGDLVNGKPVKLAVPAHYDVEACGASFAAVLKVRYDDTPRADVRMSTAPFYGIAAVRYAFEGISAAPQLPSPATLDAAILRNCSGPQAVRNFDMRKRFSQQACSSASYVRELLYGREGLFAAQPNLFKTTVADQVSIAPGVEGRISWTRGYLLQKYSR